MVATLDPTSTLKAGQSEPLSKISSKGGKNSSDALQTLSSDFDSFLLLLTTQLKNQDPTQPLDTNQFTQQIVQLSGVEQSIATNKNLEKLIGLYNQSQTGSLVNYIGKAVESEGNKGVLNNGVANFVYNLAAPAATTQVTISDASGAVVFSGQGTKTQGRNVVYWDGKNSFTGAAMPNGTYTIGVTAKDAADKAIAATTSTVGIVTAVDTKDGVSSLMLGDLAVALEKVTSIRGVSTGS